MRSFVNQIIGKARDYRRYAKRAEKSPNLPSYSRDRLRYMEEELVEYLLEDSYFQREPAERFARAFMELVRTSTPVRKRKTITAG